ncbi:UDP-3-O-(3-hydroxymyristoyl)glucosamine N-acyltransferase [Flavobacterium sp. CECT 9288]|uniref:acyltransferase n=1 Tax=Flavobacterium sp. CECT 9288 TaxID=2845819 RepID=UPI001E363CC8|nr:acyltransferase [Flavobacterium sp. CECT 9288]CAH0334855.1 UDP-3-O-(3-hydroxymyristoyl)glucosamine N-acyltransferase [Flavobacterium sp. CECT 9288]
MKFNNVNVRISAKAKIGKNVRIGDNTVIYDNVEIEDNVTICNDCIIGEPLNDYYVDALYDNPVTKIMKNSFIRSHCLFYAGSVFGENFSSGHRVTIRENSKFGNNCRVGTLSDIQGFVQFGNYCWLHSNVHIGQGSTIGNFVFIYPYVVLTNDPTPPSDICNGPTVGDYSQIAVFSVLLPGVKIGEHCLVGAGSIVGKDVGDYQLVLGSPAKFIKDVREIKSRKTDEPHYPWPQRFERGMPWANIGYEKWLEDSNKK